MLRFGLLLLVLEGCSLVTATDGDPSARAPSSPTDQPRELEQSDAAVEATPDAQLDDASAARRDAADRRDAHVAPDADAASEDALDAASDDAAVDASIAPTIGDSCEHPYVLELDDDGVARIAGTFGLLDDEHATICPNADGVLSTGPDAVFFLPIDAPSDVVIHTVGSAADTALAVGTTCSNTGFQLGCNQSSAADTTASRILVHRFDPATEGDGLYILVDAALAGETGEFLLTAWIDHVAAGTCTDPFDMSAGASVVGYIDPLGAALEGSCGGADGAETAIQFLSSVDGDARFRAYSNDFVPVLYAPGSCGGTDMACAEGTNVGPPYDGRTALDITTPGSGFYTLIVDGAPTDRVSRFLLLYEP